MVIDVKTHSLEEMLAEKQSAKKQRWRVAKADARQVEAICQRYGLSAPVAEMLAGRGFEVDTLEPFLTPKLKTSLPDPFHLHDMEKAVTRTLQAIEADESITIFGDYDVDGATSTALLIRFFRSLDVEVDHYIPDRLEEGYGPNDEAFDAIKARGTKLVITVDCGTVSHGPLQHAANIGLDVMVLDHHIGGTHLPPAVAVINPNRLDEQSEYGHLAAVGVSFLFAVALFSKLKESRSLEQSVLLNLLDLVALGTVCDVVSLTTLNRTYVAQGLEVMKKRQNIGLKALMDVAGVDAPPSAYHLGFLLGPRINAGGRVGEADLGTRLLSTQSETEAHEIAKRLDQLNKERQAIEAQVLEEATEQAERSSGNAPFVAVASEGWHEGVIGIVAGRLKEQFDKPSFVTSISEGIGKASVRSVSGVDVGSIIGDAVAQHLLQKGGGHAMAGGLSIDMEKWDDFLAFLYEKLDADMQAYAENRSVKADSIIPVSAVTPELVTSLEQLAPFGMGHSKPRFIIRDVRVLDYVIRKEQHISLTLIPGGANPGVKNRVKAMSFRSVGTALGDALMSAKGKDIHLLGTLSINEWQGRVSAEVMVEDVMV